MLSRNIRKMANACARCDRTGMVPTGFLGSAATLLHSYADAAEELERQADPDAHREPAEVVSLAERRERRRPRSDDGGAA